MLILGFRFQRDLIERFVQLQSKELAMQPEHYKLHTALFDTDD